MVRDGRARSAEQGVFDDARIAAARRRTEEALRIGALQAEVHGDLERLQAAGPALEGWTEIRFDGGDLVVLLTDPERDAPGLLALVDHPTRVRFERSRRSRRELEEARRLLEERLAAADRPDGRHVWHRTGIDRDRLTVGLNAAEHDLAHELHERFGEVLDITLGVQPFPLDPDPAPVRVELPEATLVAPDLELILEPDRSSYRPGDTIHGALRVVNHGSHRILVDLAWMPSGRVIDDAGAVVGVFVGAVAAIGRPPLSIGPGLSRTTPFLGGTTSIDPRLGAALPPGDYRLVVVVDVQLGRGGTGPRGRLVSSAVPLLVRD